MMGLLKFYRLMKWLPAISMLLAVLFFTGCAFPPKDQISILTREQDIPYRLAVLPARLMPPQEGDTGLEVQRGSENAAFLTELVRGVIHNQLAGKGFAPKLASLVNRKLSTLKGKDGWISATPKALCRLLDVNGVVYIDILSATILKALAYDQYSILAQVKIFAESGEIISDVTDSASKRKLSIPTTPVGGAMTLLQIVLDEPARKHMRMVVYDWGWKISQLLPDNFRGEAFPEIMFVQSNIDKGTFALGDTIEVNVNGEKNLTGTLNLGDFRKGIPLSSSGGGIYRGTYVVNEGDRTSRQPMEIRMVKSNGVERVWVETGGTVSIDAVPPPPPETINADTGVAGISLSWPLPMGEDLSAFVVERSETPVGGFIEATETPELTYLDSRVTQGQSYYYRVRSRDHLGNRSVPSETIQVTLPHFTEITLPEQLKGALVPGSYRIDKVATIAHGTVFRIGPGVRLRFGVVPGVLEVQGASDNPVVLEGNGWKGIQVNNSGRVDISHARLRGCRACLEATGGRLTVADAALHGDDGIGLNLQNDSLFTINHVTITGFQTGIRMDRGEGILQACTVTQNDVGIDYIRGAVRLTNNSVYENRQTDVVAQTVLVLEANYLGAERIKDANIKGDVIVRELLLILGLSAGSGNCWSSGK